MACSGNTVDEHATSSSLTMPSSICPLVGFWLPMAFIRALGAWHSSPGTYNLCFSGDEGGPLRGGLTTRLPGRTLPGPHLWNAVGTGMSRPHHWSIARMRASLRPEGPARHQLVDPALTPQLRRPPARCRQHRCARHDARPPRPTGRPGARTTCAAVTLLRPLPNLD